MQLRRDDSGRSARASLWGIAGVACLTWAGPGPALGQAGAGAQQPPSSVALVPTGGGDSSLVLDRVTVVDVEHGTLVPEQRVVIVGNRIQTVGGANVVRAPALAEVVDARGKYLIPGLWDTHVHQSPRGHLNPDAVDSRLYLANGITGIRDAGSAIPLDTLRMWQREILAGTRVGPPRQILSGQSLNGPQPDCRRDPAARISTTKTCVVDSADAVRVVDSLQAAGVDMIKMYDLSRELYFAIAAAARRRHMPFGGHAVRETAVAASDSGALIIDHLDHDGLELKGKDRRQIYQFCADREVASLEQCQALADRFRRNGTWLVPQMIGTTVLFWNYLRVSDSVWSDSVYQKDWFHQTLALMTEVENQRSDRLLADSSLTLELIQRAGLPILAGADWGGEAAGFSLHAELASYVTKGLTPLTALQAATLNPAKMWHATDSMGTVAAGKLADLVLLDADPLANITNTTRVRAVIANGHYYDRARLDRVLAEAQAEVRRRQ